MRGTLYDWKILTADSGDNRPAWVQAYLSHLGVLESSEQQFHIDSDFAKLPSPWLFRDMRAAVDIVISAMSEQKIIAIHGDYDCDGVCSSALIADVLVRAGYEKELIVYVPHREKEGYGLNMDTVRKFVEQGVSVLITTDCGSSNVEEIAFARENGLEVIVLDHHQRPPVIPNASALLNSAWTDEPFPFKELCATGVCYFFAVALLEQIKSTYSPKWFLDLVAIATIGDMMPILGVNRVLVKWGLRVLSQTRRSGLRALLAVAGIQAAELDATAVAFGIVPRLNAAGRIGHANLASNVLRSTNDAEAWNLASELNNANSERQRQTQQYVNEAVGQLPKQSGVPALWVMNAQWPLGLLGLIAGKICEQEQRPVVALSSAGGKMVASGRSPKWIDIMTMLDATRPLLEKSGGHPQACGFTIQPNISLDVWRNAYDAWAKTLPPNPGKQELVVAGNIRASDRAEIIRWLHTLEPFGHRAPAPMFCVGPVQLRDIKDLGSSGKHLAYTVVDGSYDPVRAVLFGHAEKFKKMHRDGKYHLAVSVVENKWRGRVSVEYHVKDWKYAE